MPYGISPMVIYYNTDLIDFDRMRERGLNAPEWEVDDEPTWSFDQFAAAASFATRPAKRTRGLYIEPTLRGLAPFVYSGGGALFDNEAEPTSLAFSEEETRSALERSLELLRDPHVNLTERQLAKASPEEWFVRGRVGMIAGFRSMVPRLRRVQGLNWNVMPMPAIDKAATIGDITGLCLAARGDVSMAADFLVQAASARSVAVVTRVGHLAPANLEVALSDEFLQPGRQPANARVFNASMRSMENPPLVLNWGALEEAVAQSLNRLISVPILDLDRLAAQIDRISQRVLQAENDQPAGDASESASTD